MKRIAAIGACLILGWAGVSAQNEDRVVYKGENGAKVTFFNDQLGFDMVGVSDDGRYFHGSASGGAAFIYEVGTGTLKALPEDYIGLLRVKDFKNYASTRYTMLDSVKYFVDDDIVFNHKEFNLETASGDLKTLFGGYYNPGASGNTLSAYGTLRIDAVTGKIIDTLPWVYPEMQTAGHMNKTFGASQDGKIVVGTSSAPFGFYNTSPVFWDLEADTNYYVGIGEDRESGTTGGSLSSCNNDGTLLCGVIGDGKEDERAYIIKYDKTAHTFERVAVPLWPGSANSIAAEVSETGMVVGGEDLRTFLYDMNTGEKYEMADYLRYLYGVDIPENAIPFNTTSHISDNGRVIVGTANPGAEIPYLIELGEHQIHAVARAVHARQTRGTKKVVVEWSKPLLGEYTLKGYWVYRDDVKISPTMLAANALSFTDAAAPRGTHTYAVQAVYEDNAEAELAVAAPIRVIDPGECLPVQEIYTDIVYNRTVNLYWNLPSDKATAPAARKSAAKGYKAQELDVVDVFNVKNAYASSAVRIGNYVYATAFQSDLVTILNAVTGEIEQTVAIENFKGATDLTAHGRRIYAVSNDNMVRELNIDPNNPLVVKMGTSTRTKISKLSHIAYVENKDQAVNNGDDYLVLGAYNNIMFYPVHPTGQNDTLPGSEKFNFRAYAIAGSEAYDGKLYVANNSSPSGSEVDVFELATGQRLLSQDFVKLPQISSQIGIYGMMVSGITRSELEDGMVLLQCMVQPVELSASNLLVNMELESWPETTGYNVYRDGTKVNADIVKARHYSDVVYEPGTYEYTIEYVSNTCSSKSSDAGVSAKAVINPIGECAKPGAVKAMESNNQVVLTWTRPTSNTWVGINIYRDGEQKVDLLRDQRWLDIDKLQKDKEYTYVVEAFYNNSCVASDTVVIKPTFQGKAMPPSMTALSYRRAADNTYNVELTWELPYFEAPMAYGYCGAPVGSLTPDGVSTVYALIGWDSASIPVFEDLYLVGMEYVLGTKKLTSLDGVVYIDNRIVHTEPVMDLDRIEPGEWNTLNFSKALSMNYKTELAV
ncbi:MAG: hypothetical protein K2I66_08290, partial [Bacteroidales bacterium]|nr:hypothetical protein [Bacteroidales bacterium]